MSLVPEDAPRATATTRTTNSTETDMRGNADAAATDHADPTEHTDPAEPTAPAEHADRADHTGRTLLPTAGGAECVAALRVILRGHRLLAVAAALVLVAGTAIGLLTAPLLGHIVDLVIDSEGPSALTVPLVLLVVVALAR
ncbi:hypothetical protein ACIG2K_36140, partial [Streptomyces sp. NPDC085479]